MVLPDLKLIGNKMAEGGNFQVDGYLAVGLLSCYCTCCLLVSTYISIMGPNGQ